MLSRLQVHRVSDGTDSVVATFADRHVEAPNWTQDGRWLVINSGGLLYRIPSAGGDLEQIDTAELTELNNDHVLGPDRQTIFVSNNDGHLYAVPLPGETSSGSTGVRRITQDDGPGVWHFLHGVSPDGMRLAYVRVAPLNGVPWAYRNVWTIGVDGTGDRAVTNEAAPADGPEYSPDGAWIYFNSEHGATRPGHAQLFRIRPDGAELTQLTDDAYVNWFPHVSPDGARLVYLRYPSGVEGHPGNQTVHLMLLDLSGGEPRELVELHGGQGTINVNSWAPDSDRFAYVSYESGDEPGDAGPTGSTSDGQRASA